MSFVLVTTLKDYASKDLGHSEWLTINQKQVDQFTGCTGDRQFIHVGPEKATKTSFGGTVAHGFLSLSPIPKLMGGLLVLPEGLKMAVGYGLDTVCFTQPMRVDSWVRLGLILLDVNKENPGQWLTRVCATLKTEGQEKPTYIAEALSLCFV